MSARVLVVDDDQAMCTMLVAHLGRRGFEVVVQHAAEPAFATLRQADFDVVVTDLNMQGMNGLELCERVVADRPDIPVVLITAFGSLETAIAAIRAGAYDFVMKPFTIDQFLVVLERAVQHHGLQREVTRLRRAAADAQRLGDLIGESPAMRRIYDLIDRVRDSDASVLLTGESGTGKEVVVRELHRRGPRRDGPFVAVNCAAMPEALLESELFGHAKGAFTDARAARTGLFVQADHGTLFLDEVGELPLGLQAKLLRALQERVVRPLGESTEVAFDARIIAATNRDLESAVAEQRFREDLFYRINVIQLELPPLRSRGNDCLILAQHFLERFALLAGKRVSSISAGAVERLRAYSWPGNVRELSNCIERAVALAQYAEVVVEDLPDKIKTYRQSHVVVMAEDPAELLPMAEVERRYIERVLEASGGNKTVAARLLGFDRTTLYRKLQRSGLTGNEGDDG